MVKTSAVSIAAIVALLYALFFKWYGSGGEPIDRKEAFDTLVASGAEKTVAEAMVSSLLPSDDDDGRSFLMLNLVKQRAEASYGNRPDLKPQWVTSGRDADQYYASQFLPKILKRAGHPVFVSRSVARAALMLPDGLGKDARDAFSDWDYFALVRYRCMRDLVDAVAELTSELGSDAMFVLKHSGVERTYVLPIFSPAYSHAVRSGVLLFAVAAIRALSKK